MYWGSEGIPPHILNLGAWWKWDLRPGRFTPRERAPGAHWIGGSVGTKASLEAVVKRQITSLTLPGIPTGHIVSKSM